MIKVSQEIMDRQMAKLVELVAPGNIKCEEDMHRQVELILDKHRKNLENISKTDSVYGLFIERCTESAVNTILKAAMTSMLSGDPTLIVKTVQFVVADSLRFSYDLLQEAATSDFWTKQLADINKINEES